VSFLVRVAGTPLEERLHSSRAEAAPPAPRRWVRFSAVADAGGQDGVGGGVELDAHYRLEAVRTVRGTPLRGWGAGTVIHRREGDTTGVSNGVGSVGGPIWLAGAAEPKRSCSDEHEARLQAAWGDSPWRVALLLAFRHSRTFWALPREQRAGTYLQLGGEAQGHKTAPVLNRVVHRLYRGRSLPESEWDYLAYFEMQPPDVAYVREHLQNLREVRHNPLWSFVDREAEMWMTRQITPPRI
jgi:hypothetical protein